MSGTTGTSVAEQPSLVLRSLPYLDEKWLRADLYGALQSTEDLAILWNNLVKDHELLTTSVGGSSAVNSAGSVSYSIAGGHHYCGVQKLTCSCCTGVCRPFSGCNCGPCQQLDDEAVPTKRKEQSGHYAHRVLFQFFFLIIFN